MKKDLKKAMLYAVAAVFALGAAAPAHAWRDDSRWRSDDRWDRHDRGNHYGHSRYRDRYVNRVVVTHRYSPRYYDTAPASYSSGNCRSYYNPLPVVLGAGAGGLIGSGIGKGSGRTAAIISGALLGGALMSPYTVADQHCTRDVFDTAPVGRPVTWHNSETDYAYAVTPIRDIRTEGRYCREYQATATIGTRTQETYGTACMQPDGSWEIVD